MSFLSLQNECHSPSVFDRISANVLYLHSIDISWHMHPMINHQQSTTFFVSKRFEHNNIVCGKLDLHIQCCIAFFYDLFHNFYCLPHSVVGFLASIISKCLFESVKFVKLSMSFSFQKLNCYVKLMVVSNDFFLTYLKMPFEGS